MRQSIAIIGSGPAALMFASRIDPGRFEVSIYERNTAPARKFLVAGDGGLNLTHGEVVDSFVSKYTPPAFMERYVRHFDNNAMRAWLQSIGVETWVGSSNRVFPKPDFTPAEVLKKIVDHTLARGVHWQFRHFFRGWDNAGSLLFESPAGVVKHKYDFVVYALGGASWPVTGSDGGWFQLFVDRGIECKPFAASNCSFLIDWPENAIDKLEGRILKNIRVSHGDSVKAGELVVTRKGLEGGAIYALSSLLRAKLQAHGHAILHLDLKPTLTEQQVLNMLSEPGKPTEKLRKLVRLSDAHLTLLKSIVYKTDFLDTAVLARKIKALPLTVVGSAPIEEAISTAGGVALSEVDADLQLRQHPREFCIGEMLDWDAPTGGYLLQAAFSMGAYVADRLNALSVAENG